MVEIIEREYDDIMELIIFFPKKNIFYNWLCLPLADSPWREYQGGGYG
jgi:hypothetical protein